MSELEQDMWDREYPSEEESDLMSQGGTAYEDDEVAYESDEVAYEDDSTDWEDYIDEEFDEEVSVVDNARIRLEQGRLYEMLIQHNLFDGVDAAPEAVDRVQKEIKNFITDRLEILLGMKAEKETEVHQIINPSQFNDVEVQALKMIASKVTKGASTDAQTSEPTPSELNTIKKAPIKKGLNTLGTKKPVAKPQPARSQKSVPSKKKTESKPLRKTSKSPPQKQRKLKKDLAEVSAGGKSVDEIAKRDIKYIDTLKNMTLEDAGKVVSARHNRPKSPTVINQDVVNANYSNKMAVNETAQTFQALLANAKRI